jgi:hypothetical protein
VLFYSGEPLPAQFHKNCTKQKTQPRRLLEKDGEPPGPPGYVNIGCVLSIATTTNLSAPFRPIPHLTNFTPAGAETLFCHTNPTAHIFPNGTTLLYFRTAESNGQNEQIWVARASSYDGHYTMLAKTPLLPTANSPLIGGRNVEDPFVFRNQRGHFILMFHQSHWGPGWNGAKAWSEDGVSFHWSETSMSRAWSSRINYTDGSSTVFRRREEPKIYVEGGQMLAMFNAVQEPSGGTYVMSQAIRSKAT